MQNEPQEPESLYAEAAALIADEGKASTSFIQRRLGIGYVKAAALIERMQAEGLVSEADHLGKRDVLIEAGETLEGWRAKRQRQKPHQPTGGMKMGDEPKDGQTTPGSNHLIGEEVRSYVERLERIDSEIGEKKDFRKEIMAEAKARGHGTKYLQALVDLRKKKPSDREEEESMLELYKHAVGMATDLPLFRHVQGMATDVTNKEAVLEALKLLAPMDGELTIKVGSGTRMRISRNKDGVTVEEVPDAPLQPLAAGAQATQAKKPGADAPDVDEAGAFELGREARKDDAPVIANPFAWDDARRRRWDEGWRDQDGGDGMGPR